VSLQIDLAGSTALVTGGGHGVGRAVSMSLAAAGARVLVNDYFADRAEAVALEIEAAGGAGEARPFDVSDYAAATAGIGAGPAVDILVNNAGNAGSGGGAAPVSVGPFAETEPASWARYLAVNLHGVMCCTRAALPGMIAAGRGRVITVISEAGRVGEPRMAPYAAAKAGAAGFMRAVAREVGAAGITVNCVALAAVDTMGLAERAGTDPEMAVRLERQLRRYVVRRLGQPEDVSGLITFLASPLAGWITGQTLPVNGGYTFNQ
jgi:NAD(P)-dependent dehydrogenase (short-subunit alcohol dehydrogenase family)